MRRLIVLYLMTMILITSAAVWASAKGIATHAKVTISGAGLPGGTVSLGEDGAEFTLTSGIWERKWDVPNIGGVLEPNVELGPAYVVRVVLDCDDGGRSRYRQTLYPNAPGGPQLFTPGGIDVCGVPAQPGFDPIGATLVALLRSHGIEFHAIPGTSRAPRKTSVPSGGSHTALPIAAFGGLAAAAAIAVEIARRRRRVAT